MQDSMRAATGTFLLLLGALFLSGCRGGSDLEAGEAALAGGTLSSSSPLSVGRQSPSSPGASAELERSRETAVVRAAERVSPGIVAVNVLRTQQVRTRDPFFDDFFSPFGLPWGSTTTRVVPSLGSGFIVDPSGIVLTNDHVVRGAERILVSLPDGRDAEAELVGSDPATDVAVLRIRLDGLVAVPLGTAEDLRIGEWLIAFGNPFGHLLSNPEPSVTVGVASALHRHISPSLEDRGSYLGMIQTDAAINPGNSGGPLVNAEGEVVGMNTSILSRSGGSEGMGFAVPIDRALRIAEDLLEHGRVRRPWLGIRVEPEVADAFGRTRGVRVAEVQADSPGGRAGVRVGDRITAADGVRLVTPLDFEAALLDLRAGEAVALVVNDGAAPIRIVSDELPSYRAPRVRVFGGLEVVTLTDAIRSERGVASPTGALVTGLPSGSAGTLGLAEGDVIVGLNNRRIQGAEELATLLEQLPGGSRALLTFERGGLFVEQPFIQGR